MGISSRSFHDGLRPLDGAGFFGAGADGETTGAVGCVLGVTLGVTAGGVAFAGADGVVAGWLLPVCFVGGAIVAASASESRLIVAT